MPADAVQACCVWAIPDLSIPWERLFSMAGTIAGNLVEHYDIMISVLIIKFLSAC